MPQAAGNFTSSTLFAMLDIADRMWADNMVRPDYEAKADIVRYVQGEQTATIEPFDGDKDVDVKIWWTNACDITAVALADDCVVGGTELSTDHKTYSLTRGAQASFSIKQKAMRTNATTYEEQVAKGTLKALKVLDEYWAQTMVGVIESFEGTNTYVPAGWTFDPTEKHTVVPTGDWGVGMIPHLILTGTLNRFSDPFILSGRNLFIPDWEAMYNGANADGRGEAARFQAIRKYYDLFNIDTVNSPELKTYLINRGAVAFVTRAYADPTPTNYFDQTQYSVESRNLSGVRYDVHYNNVCSSDEITHNFTFKTKGDILLNPTGCETGRTGVLTFLNQGGGQAI